MHATTATAPTGTYRPLLQACAKCKGTGKFVTQSGRVVGPCFACDGEGKVRTAAAAEAAAPTVQTAELYAAFERAAASGLKHPRIRLGQVAITKAPATGRNAGALYVKRGRGEDGVYLGKIVGGKFFGSRDCSETDEKSVTDLLANPLQEAMAHGQRTGVCCMCGLELTDPVSIANGIGPVCAERWFG